MKYHTTLFTITLNIIMTSFHTYGMENINTSIQQQPSDQISKKFSSLRKAMNEVAKNNPKANEPFITRTIEEMRDAGILDTKYYYYDYVYNKKTKPYIFKQFFTHYPEQICPELRSIFNTINDDYDRQDFLTILSMINSQNEYTQQYIRQIRGIIQNKENTSTYKNKIFSLKDTTTNVIHQALNAICLNLNEEYTSRKEYVISSNNKAKEIALITKINTQQQLLGDLLTIEKSINTPHHFTFFFNKIAEKRDPKDEAAMRLPALYKQRLETEAINSINAIVSQYPLRSEQLQLIEDRFHENSASLLRKTVAHNQRILDANQNLLDYSQEVITQEQDLSKAELPQLSLEPEHIEINTSSPEPFAYTIKSTSKRQPASIKKKFSDQDSQKSPQSPNPFTRLINSVWSGISNTLNTIYNGVVWFVEKINIFKT